MPLSNVFLSYVKLYQLSYSLMSNGVTRHQSGEWQYIAFYGKSEIRGYVVHNTIIVYVIWFGTKSLSDLKSDLQFFKTCLLCHNDKSLKVHSGFQTLALECLPILNEIISPLQSARLIIFIGHSLGSALAVLNSLFVRRFKYSWGDLIKELNLFCPPKIGNKYFSQWYARTDSQLTINIILNKYDPVTKLPPTFFGYKSLIGNNVFLFKENKRFGKHSLTDIIQ